MTCEEARKNLPLFLYGELSFDEEELVEIHVDECDSCRKELDLQKTLFAALDAVEMVPSAEALAKSRAELRSRLALAGQPSGMSPVRGAGFWDKLREGFTIHFHFAPGLAQVAGAAAMLALGFVTARMTPNSVLGNWHSAGMIDPATSRVRYVEPVSPGRVQIVLDSALASDGGERSLGCRIARGIGGFAEEQLTIGGDSQSAGVFAGARSERGCEVEGTGRTEAICARSRHPAGIDASAVEG
jgi:hypothetical protein